MMSTSKSASNNFAATSSSRATVGPQVTGNFHRNRALISRRNQLLTKLKGAIRTNPRLALVPNKYGELPIAFVWRLFQSCFDEVTSRDEVLEGGRLANVWDMITLLLQVGYHGKIITTDNETFRVLHAAAGTFCPVELIHFVLEFFPEQAFVKDEQGLCPLNIAAASVIPAYAEEEMNEYGHAISLRSCDPSKGKIDMIYEANPEAATVCDNNSCYPLHIAVSNGKRWNNGIQCLLRALPDALSIAANDTALYPFQLSAIGNDGDLSTTYMLLRAMPDLIATPHEKIQPSSKRRRKAGICRLPLKKRRLKVQK